MHSLHGRLLLASTLVLAGFIGATGLALDKAFRVSARASMQDRLQSYIYALLAAAGEDERGRMVPPRKIPEPRFSKPDSGLYAMIAGPDGTPLWHSRSLAGRRIDIVQPQVPAQREFRRFDQAGLELYGFSFGVAWEDYAKAEELYTFAVAEDASAFEDQIESFRRSLWGWLGAMAVVLLVAQGLILRWGLRPLRRVEADLQRIERGAAQQLEGAYPRELEGLTSSLNSLIEHGKLVQTRYRNSLDDLAHSLKTPLALMQSFCERKSEQLGEEHVLVSEQVERMDEIIEHQLQRAAVSGQATLGRQVQIQPVVERLVRSLDKVYREKRVDVGLDLDPAAMFYGDEADLTEALGNLLDNAYKYCSGRVRVSVRSRDRGDSDRGVAITLEDDGQGIAPAMIDTVLQRGRRVDETVPGHGIGLSMAREIITLYGGHLDIDSGGLGGARVRVRFDG
ncbi:MAG: ATP-binding protein [Gammaproteobacteria bacterium]|jgi:two-component system sensor histidine kinase PhoQ